ncbi:MAG: UDP-N-acetylmuramate dehydrogenase [Gammaproteobacteria bacterium]|nr:UDP-N-acetylmuramate dehydrogenase [Gammaproteobacteria bacterium]
MQPHDYARPPGGAHPVCKVANVTDWFDRLTVRGPLRQHEPMAKYCSWRVGGAAEYFFEPTDRDDLLQFLRGLPNALPVTWIGLGSNVLIRAGGLVGAAIITTRALTNLVVTHSATIEVEAGVPCAKVAKRAVRAGLVGAEFLAGIPGTIGGALAMNAGAFGSDTWSFVESVETVDRRGEIRHRPKQDYRIDYRMVIGPEQEWFLSCVLRFASAPTVDISNRIRELLGQRNTSQPIGVPSCGSVFKNPPGDYAGRLIDAAGLKGTRHGGCRISDKHANFIINDGEATAEDIESLIQTVITTVSAKFGITLQPEVRIVGQQAVPPTGAVPTCVDN